MKLFSIDVKVAATAYIVADSEQEAREHFEANFAEYMGDELPTGGIVQGGSYESLVELADEGMGNVSLSPAITYHGAYGSLDAPEAFEMLAEFDLEGDE